MVKTHTPGPWRVGDGGHAVFGPKGGGMYPAIPVTIVQRVVNPANAKLIACAPEMYNLLCDIEAWFGQNQMPLDPLSIGVTDEDVAFVELLKRVIDKAGGGI